MSINIYAFYNNKGGVGKTTLCSNAAPSYARANPDCQVLVFDLCPQANISQFLLGGGKKGYDTNQKIQASSTRKNIVGFVDWLLKGNSDFTKTSTSFRIDTSRHNSKMPENLFLVAGDSFLESLSLALNYAVINPANMNAWKEYMTALRRLAECEFDTERYDRMTVFIDCNPSFSIYTQMALVSSDRLIIPVMADYSSMEGIKGIFTLLYGKYPSSALQRYADGVITFSKQIGSFGLELPRVFSLVFNNFTTNLGPATAYGSIKQEILTFCHDQFVRFPELFVPAEDPPVSFSKWQDLYFSDVKDFHTAGKVSASLGIPLLDLTCQSSYDMPDGTKVKLPSSNYTEAVKHVERFVQKLQ